MYICRGKLLCSAEGCAVVHKDTMYSIAESEWLIRVMRLVANEAFNSYCWSTSLDRLSGGTGWQQDDVINSLCANHRLSECDVITPMLCESQSDASLCCLH